MAIHEEMGAEGVGTAQRAEDQTELGPSHSMHFEDQPEPSIEGRGKAVEPVMVYNSTRMRPGGFARQSRERLPIKPGRFVFPCT